MSVSAPDDAFLVVNDAHLRVYGNVHADGLKLGQLEVVTTTSTGSTINFLHQHTAFTTTSNILVGTTNSDLFVDTLNSRVGVLTNTPATTLDVNGTVTATSFSDGTSTLTGGTWSGSAAKLTTAVNIGGVAFDGSTSISLPGVDLVGSQSTTGSAAKLTTPVNIGGVAFDGSASIVPTTFGAATFSGDVTVDTNTFHVDGANSRVGIGTTSPLVTLDTHGTMRSSAPYPRFDFYTTTNRSTNAWGNSTDNAGDYRIYSNGDASDGTKRSLNFDYGQNSTHTTRMAINANGFVGIRTTSPSFPLSVSDASVKQWNAFDNNTTQGDYTFTKSGIYLVGFMYGDGADGNTCEYYTITAATSHGANCGVTQHKNSGYLNYAVQDHNTVRFWSGSPSSALPPGFNSSNFHLRIYFAGYF